MQTLNHSMLVAPFQSWDSNKSSFIYTGHSQYYMVQWALHGSNMYSFILYASITSSTHVILPHNTNMHNKSASLFQSLA
jgi:hypothetical protein